MLCVFSPSAQQYNATADSTLSRKRRIGNGEDASAAKKPKQEVEEDSDVAEDAGEGDGVCTVIVARCVEAVNAFGLVCVIEKNFTYVRTIIRKACCVFVSDSGPTRFWRHFLVLDKFVQLY